ncbi:unnamed protein product [Phytophthora fragariaefolia]|uniref:Unnamed protein product n=1 Tax=Phytophthora fragariaefolia TaxID=1490495 RepID=A0A9W7D3R8_9STRA|nr:unnamed protein product [Phytophthora fragariaefolia]
MYPCRSDRYLYHFFGTSPIATCTIFPVPPIPENFTPLTKFPISVDTRRLRSGPIFNPSASSHRVSFHPFITKILDPLRHNTSRAFDEMLGDAVARLRYRFTVDELRQLASELQLPVDVSLSAAAAAKHLNSATIPKTRKQPGTNSDTEGAETTPALQLQQAVTLQDQDQPHLPLVDPDRPAVRQKFAAVDDIVLLKCKNRVYLKLKHNSTSFRKSSTKAPVLASTHPAGAGEVQGVSGRLRRHGGVADADSNSAGLLQRFVHVPGQCVEPLLDVLGEVAAHLDGPQPRDDDWHRRHDVHDGGAALLRAAFLRDLPHLGAWLSRT